MQGQQLMNFIQLPEGTEPIAAYYAARIRGQKLLERNNRLAFSDNHFAGCGWRNLIIPFQQPPRRIH